MAYHAYQSFKPGEVTPELCHKLRVELAKRMWGDEYQVLVAAHFNTGTCHNHFVVNPVGLRDGRKCSCGKRACCQFRELSDDLCKEYPFSAIKNLKGKTPLSIYFAEKKGEPTRYNLMREALDIARKLSVDGKRRQTVNIYCSTVGLWCAPEPEVLEQEYLNHYKAMRKRKKTAQPCATPPLPDEISFSDSRRAALHIEMPPLLGFFRSYLPSRYFRACALLIGSSAALSSDSAALAY